MRTNTLEVFRAWQAGRRKHSCDAVWTDGHTIYSYSTSIVYRSSSSGKWRFNVHRYSPTTSTQQRGLAQLLDAAGIAVIIEE